MSALTRDYRGRADELAAAERWLAAHAAELPAVLRRNIEPAARAHRGHSVAVGLELADTADRADGADPLAWLLAAETAEALVGGAATDGVRLTWAQVADLDDAVRGVGRGYRGRAAAARTRERRRHAMRQAEAGGQLVLLAGVRP